MKNLLYVLCVAVFLSMPIWAPHVFSCIISALGGLFLGVGAVAFSLPRRTGKLQFRAILFMLLGCLLYVAAFLSAPWVKYDWPFNILCAFTILTLIVFWFVLPFFLRRRFRSLAEQWKKETIHLSGQRERHPAYRKIISMGRSAIPLIMKELRTNPDWWFSALAEITGENLSTEEAAGKLDKLTEIWLKWGKEHGY